VAGLEEAGFAYALAGAIALAFWSTPRATVDIDVAVDADALRVPDLIAALKKLGCDIDEERALEAAVRGDLGARIDGIRIDLFLPVLSLSRSALDRRVRVPFGDREVWVLAAEDVALFKLIFARTKDFADLERLFAMQRDRLDYSYLARWVATIFAPEDSRVARFNALVAAARFTSGT
jgi:hypothetical protein